VYNYRFSNRAIGNPQLARCAYSTYYFRRYRREVWYHFIDIVRFYEGRTISAAESVVKYFRKIESSVVHRVHFTRQGVGCCREYADRERRRQYRVAIWNADGRHCRVKATLYRRPVLDVSDIVANEPCRNVHNSTTVAETITTIRTSPSWKQRKLRPLTSLPPKRTDACDNTTEFVRRKNHWRFLYVEYSALPRSGLRFNRDRLTVSTDMSSIWNPSGKFSCRNCDDVARRCETSRATLGREYVHGIWQMNRILDVVTTWSIRQ